MNKKEPKIGSTSKTPEMIPSMFNWIEPDRQRRTAKKLANITKSDSDKDE